MPLNRHKPLQKRSSISYIQKTTLHIEVYLCSANRLVRVVMPTKGISDYWWNPFVSISQMKIMTKISKLHKGIVILHLRKKNQKINFITIRKKTLDFTKGIKRKQEGKNIGRKIK